MKKSILAVGLSAIMLLSACSGTEDASSEGQTTEENKSKGTIAPEDFDKMYSDPSSYKDYDIEFTGKVFTEPERDETHTYLQIFAKPENSEQNTLVGIADPELKVNMGDYVKVNGFVKEQYEGENMMGAEIVAPVIDADSVEIVDYVTAVSPTIKSIDINKEIDQQGFVVTLQKIELAEKQTRVYLKVNNKSDSTVYLNSSSTKLLVENKQLEQEYVFESGLPELQSEILSGVESEGVIVYPAVDVNTQTLKLHAEGYSDNYNITIDPFVFDVTVD
jgi:hypothetical protein